MSDFEERLRIQIDKEESNEIAKIEVHNEKINSRRPFEAYLYLSYAKRYIDIWLPMTEERISSGVILALTIGNEIMQGPIVGVEKGVWQYVSVLIQNQKYVAKPNRLKGKGKGKKKLSKNNAKYADCTKCTKCEVIFNNKPYESMRHALYNFSLIDKGAYDAIRGIHPYIPKQEENNVSLEILREMEEIEKSAVLSSLTQNLTVVTVKILSDYDYVGWYRYR